MEKETIILGAGESGVGAALLAQRLGRRVFVSDAGTPDERYLSELFDAGIEYEAGGHSRERILQAEIVIKSPGIPDKVQLIKDLKVAGIEVIAEVEYACRFMPPQDRIVAITGSNGKTTTTMLTHHLLKAGGVKVEVGGNIGVSFARLLLDRFAVSKTMHPTDAPVTYVLELSSFQLDGITTLRPDVATVLNITPDHLDRYDYHLENYADSKLRIAMNQKEENTFLIYFNDQTPVAALERAKLTVTPTVIEDHQIGEQGKIYCGYDSFSLATTLLRGKHNALNALFAIQIAQVMGVTAENIQIGLDTFQPAAHRMENVRILDGVTYINDSKATNVDAVYYALDAMTAPTVWIAGGTDKGNDYRPVMDLAAEKVHTLICLGVDNQKLIDTFSGSIANIIETRSAQDAVEKAHQVARSGDMVLLSPACASFDLFKNYMDRGDQFRAAVQALLSTESTATLKSPAQKSSNL